MCNSRTHWCTHDHIKSFEFVETVIMWKKPKHCCECNIYCGLNRALHKLSLETKVETQKYRRNICTFIVFSVSLNNSFGDVQMKHFCLYPKKSTSSNCSKILELSGPTFPSYPQRCSYNKFLPFIYPRFSFLVCVSLLKYERITSLEILVKRNKHVAVPGANSFSVIHGYRLHGGLFMKRITSVFCCSETLIISLWSCVHSVLVSLIGKQSTVHRTSFYMFFFEDLCCLSCLNLQ